MKDLLLKFKKINNELMKKFIDFSTKRIKFSINFSIQLKIIKKF